jgi:hypothetical protein
MAEHAAFSVKREMYRQFCPGNFVLKTTMTAKENKER